MLAGNLDEIFNKFDFTDSIVTQVKWSENLTDLFVIVDYYWDIQEGRDQARQLKIIFRNCKKAHFNITKELPLEDSASIFSCFTIVMFTEKKGSALYPCGYRNIEIYTTDYSEPWLSLSCSEVLLEEEPS